MTQPEVSRTNAQRILNTYHRVLINGVLRKPRGEECVDFLNGEVTLHTEGSPLTSFTARKLNLNYAKKELLWYLEADPYADWIQQHATMWKKLKQPDGRFFSNYGQYIFNWCAGNDYSQFEFVVSELKRDKDSRRAVMVLLQPYHLFHENSDVVCTYAMHFAIYDDFLHMNVMMRSNDLVYGFTNDAFCFWCIYQMVYALLQEHYPDLRRGAYCHRANSLHIYGRHFEMVKQILAGGTLEWNHINIPFVTAAGVRHLLVQPGEAPDEFTRWLATVD